MRLVISPENAIRKNLDKNITETNKRVRNYCRQKEFDYIDNSNITEDSLGVKKLHLNRKGNSFSAKNLLGMILYQK